MSGKQKENQNFRKCLENALLFIINVLLENFSQVVKVKKIIK